VALPTLNSYCTAPTQLVSNQLRSDHAPPFVQSRLAVPFAAGIRRLAAAVGLVDRPGGHIGGRGIADRLLHRHCAIRAHPYDAQPAAGGSPCLVGIDGHGTFLLVARTDRPARRDSVLRAAISVPSRSGNMGRPQCARDTGSCAFRHTSRTDSRATQAGGG
jgi:hypothetical protein